MSRWAPSALLLIGLFFAGTAHADSVLRTWGSEQGLEQHTVTSIVQTPDGYLWLGTGAGLIRFDGLTFRRYARHVHPELPSDRINSLVLDGERLWIQTPAGLAWMEGGRFGRIEEVPRPMKPVLLPGGGGVWVPQVDGPIWTSGPDEAAAAALSAAAPENIDAILFTRDGGAWATESPTGRVLRWEPGGGPVMEVQLPVLDPLPRLELGDGSILVGDDERLFRLRGTTVTEVEELPTPLAALVEPDGSMLVATREGVLRVDAQLRVQGRVPGLEGIANALLRDREGHVWIGTSERGLARLATPEATTLPLPPGFAQRSTSVVTEDAAGGVWVSVPCEGAVRILDGAVERVLGAELDNSCIWAITEHPIGTIWIGTWGGGLYRYDLATGAITDHWGPDQGFGHAFKAVLPELDGNLLVGTNAGLFRLADGALAAVDGVGHVQSLRRGPDGAVWIASDEGVFVLRGGSIDKRTDLGARDVHLLGERALLASYGRGLLLLDGDEVRPLGREYGFEDDYLGRILQDPLGALWITGNGGLVRVDPDRLVRAIADQSQVPGLLRLTAEHGLPSSECNGGAGPSGFVRDDGTLFVPTIKGVGVVDTRALARTRAAIPSPSIERIDTDHRVLDPAPEVVVLSPAERGVTVEFTGLLLHAPGQIRFRTRLDDKPWTDAGDRRSVIISSLEPGEHVFAVQARLAGAEWSTPATVRLSVKARLWETRGFMAAAVVLGFLAFLLVVRFYERREARVQRLVDQRTAELAAANALLAQRANEDLLTGVASRRLFEDRLSLFWGVARRDDKPLSLLMLDVDRFKELNDTYGHPAGDRSLAELGRRLSSRARRAMDVVARYGGEEFAILLPDTDASGAERMAELLWGAVRGERFDLGDGIEVRITASVGVATRHPRHGGSPEELIAAADRALYQAKHTGRDRVVSAGPDR